MFGAFYRVARLIGCLVLAALVPAGALGYIDVCDTHYERGCEVRHCIKYQGERLVMLDDGTVVIQYYGYLGQTWTYYC